jgi:hypothetical protein
MGGIGSRMFNRTPLSMGMGGMTAIAQISLADVRLDIDSELTPSTVRVSDSWAAYPGP